jgi:hypothetical protein
MSGELVSQLRPVCRLQQNRQASTQVGGRIEQVMGQALDTFGVPAGASRSGALIPGAELDSLVSTRPATALMIAMGVGYVLARLMHR